MRLQQIRDAVRAQLDLPDEDDLATPLLDLYIEEGVDQTVNMEARWPFLQAAWVVHADVSAHTIVMPPDVRHIVSVVNEAGETLERIGHQFAESNFTSEVRTPVLYSTWGPDMYVWPRPDQDATLAYVIRGYRAPAPMNGVATASPDMDARLHASLAHYACSRAYAQQEDEVLANFYLQTWSATVNSARTAIMRPEFQGLWAMGGDRRSFRRVRARLS